ncbi:MAG: response regulator [Pirellulales bacterium]
MSKRILVCDDSMLMRKIVSDALVEDGWEVVSEADNGARAAEMYQELKPDAVTMDIVMPEYNGIHGLEQIIKFDPNAVVVMVSALSKTEMIFDAIRKGAQDFIVKPFLPELLQETMARIMKAHQVNAS